MRGIAILLTSFVLMLSHQHGFADDTTNQLTTKRKAELTHMVLQDCGSCHGMKLTGGLGSPITPSALSSNNPDVISSIIATGIPGTAMPPWNAILPEREIQWIAEQLIAGGFLK